MLFNGRVSQSLFFGFVLAITVAGCSAFLRAGHIEETPQGRKLVLPQQDGQNEARGWTKSFVPSLVRASGRKIVEVVVVLRPHVRSLQSYVPTSCNSVVFSTNATDGVSATPRYEDQGGGVEVFSATFALADLAPLASTDGAVDLTLCDYRYRFGGASLADLVK